ncbi:MAG: HIT domain-containing protein [Chloroflexaceae bacterium]|nr:HIT domain-containing protein [Chloroflexaceae bacterium]NJO06973.1 HIT domain-containing protein [Chloroflexaceae bacterium]
MEIQFTPWRMKYIKSHNAPPSEACVLCTIAQADPANDPQHYLLHRGQHCYVVLNIYPYNTAHLMIVPYRHTADLPGLDAASATELFDLTRRSLGYVNAEYQPHGSNLGMNLGKVAGAGIAEHLHMHIVPRWGGDMNFLPVIGGVKLIPEDLDETYQRLRPYFEQG